jgi:predicted nucleotidyltransferase
VEGTMTQQELSKVIAELEDRGIDCEIIGGKSFDEILEAVNAPDDIDF